MQIYKRKRKKISKKIETNFKKKSKRIDIKEKQQKQQDKIKQYKTKQNKTKQNKTIQNKTK